MELNVSRRGFIAGTAATAAVCATGAGITASEAKAEAAAAKTIDCDIVVVGAGNSGLAACVQAAELGAKVVCVERQAEREVVYVERTRSLVGHVVVGATLLLADCVSLVLPVEQERIETLREKVREGGY